MQVIDSLHSRMSKALTLTMDTDKVVFCDDTLRGNLFVLLYVPEKDRDNDGYYFLKPSDCLQEDDEFVNNLGVWEAIENKYIGWFLSDCANGCVIRRHKSNMNFSLQRTGYYHLMSGDTIEASDEYFVTGQGWEIVPDNFIGVNYISHLMIPIRRKI